MEIALLADLVTDLPHAVRLPRLVRQLREHFCCGAVALLRLEGAALRPLAVDGLVRDALGRRFMVAEHPRLATILTSRQPVSFDHDTRLPDPYDGLLDGQEGLPLPVHDCMGVALYLEGNLWGAVTLDALRPGTFNDASRDALSHYRLFIEAAVRVTRLEEERRSLSLLGGCAEAGGDASPAREILGQSPAIQTLLHDLDMVADSELPVLLLGETGVGKELVARQLHTGSRRHGAPLVQVNCAALPETLAESELFGHVRGAFSGATTDRAGRFEAAHGGTLFLDEVGELPLAIQAKLLRALQNGEIQRLGEDAPRRVDVRIIAATNRHLRDGVRQGVFRADLYHRLSVFPVMIPPLRERGTDVLLLAGHFLELNRARLGARSLRLSPAAEEALCRYHWPGNVRELEHVISRAALRTVSRAADRRDIITINLEMLDLESDTDAVPLPTAVPSGDRGAREIVPLREQVIRLQRQAIQQAWDLGGHSWANTARRLDMDPSNLRKLVRRLGLTLRETP